MPSSQTDSFKELGAFLQIKTGSSQAWNRRYKPGLDRYIEKYGVDVLIGSCLKAEFTKVEYAFEIWQGLDNRTEDQEWWIPAARERYHEMKKRLLSGKFKGSELAAFADQIAITTRTKKVWDPVEKLREIQERTGLPRGPEAVEHARKWGIEIGG